MLVCPYRTQLTKPQRDFGTNYDSIPPHGRWRHIDAGLPRVELLLGLWRSSPKPPSDKEVTKRLIDLFLVSVLLDAGAGNVWSYTEPSSGQKFARSEGLGVASIHMFTGGLFSGDPDQPYRVDGEPVVQDNLAIANPILAAKGLAGVSTERIAAAFQVTESNPMVGLEGRTSLLMNLSKALASNSEFFGPDARPGNIIGEQIFPDGFSIAPHVQNQISWRKSRRCLRGRRLFQSPLFGTLLSLDCRLSGHLAYRLPVSRLETSGHALR